ncbi:MAG TPA: peptidase M19, partial [Candidatus Binatia bacterium]|nr:peptidase M19 [Candidatus Binatia bacterium]
HQQMYYKWVERAYKAGLRTMTIHGTNIEALCNVAVQTGGNKDPDVMDEDCVDMSVGEKQIDYVHAIQDYIDAQEGGPGKGWFRIVMSPAEARDVIAEGKLAVITGLEFSNLFGCTVTFAPDGSETSGCTKEQIDAGVEEAWNRGIRQIFAYHDVDSALGGTGIFSFALDLVGYYGTHGFWKTYDCADGGEGPAWFYDGGTYMYSDQFPAGFGSDPITLALIEATQGTFPLYPSGKRQCNARGVTDLGMYALDRLMRKGFVLDIDHSEVSIKQYMLDQGKLVAPNYPMLSAHGGHGGITDAQATQMIKQGGLIYPALPNGKEYADFVQKVKKNWTASGTSRPLAVGYGADSNGLRNLPTPRGAGSTPVVYPFTLFQGAGWGPQYGAAKIAPLKVDQLAIPDGRSWDINEEGMSHYGLVPDVIEEARIEGGQETTDAIYRSAEAYLQMWEQTQSAAAEWRKKPLLP